MTHAASIAPLGPGSDGGDGSDQGGTTSAVVAVPAPPRPALRGALHLAAFPVAVVGGLVLTVAVADDARTRVGAAVFGLASALLFGVSALYHRGNWSPARRALLRRLDHSNIFVMIAASYTPMCLALLDSGTLRPVLAIAWAGAAAGVVFRVVWLSAPVWLYTPFYLGLGWVAVVVLPDFARSGGPAVVTLIAVGGLAYTVGGLVYALRRPNPWPATFGYHELFHTGTLVGFGSHYAAVVLALT